MPCLDRANGFSDHEHAPVSSPLPRVLAALLRAGVGRRRRSHAGAEHAGSRAPAVALPNKPGSLKFAVIGDFGTGEQAAVPSSASRWLTLRTALPLRARDHRRATTSTARDRPQDFGRSSRRRTRRCSTTGVKFYASLGNHDSREQRYYKLFNMDGKLYYTFKAPTQDVRFFALESNYLDPEQLEWLEKELDELERALEDRVLPPPAVFVGQAPRLAHRPARGARAAVRQVQRQRRARGPRPLLRAHQAAEGHRLLRHRVRRPAAEGQHRPPHRTDGHRLRHRSGVPGRRDRRRRAVLQRHLAPRHGRRLGRHRAPERGVRPLSDSRATAAPVHCVVSAETARPSPTSRLPESAACPRRADTARPRSPSSAR